MEIIRIFCWGFTAAFFWGAYKFYELGLSPYASSQTGGIVFCLICAIIGLVISIKFEITDWKDRSEKNKAQQKKQKQFNEAMQQYRDATWRFPTKKFYEHCTKNGLTELNNSYSLEKAKLLAITIMRSEKIPVPDEYHHLYITPEKLGEYFQMGKQETMNLVAIEKRKQEAWNRTPHKASPNESQKTLLSLAQKLRSLRGIEKRRMMLNSSLEKLDEEIRRKKEGQEALRQVGFLMASSATQQKKSDWAILGGIAEGIAGPGAGAAVAIGTMQKNADIEQWNRQNQAAINRVALDIASSANGLNATIREMETAKRLLSSELSALDQKVVLSDCKTVDLWNKLDIHTDNVVKTETNVLEIKISIKNGYTPNVPENVRITVDGVLSAKVYFKDTLVSTTIVPLPLYGVECKTTATLTSLCEDYMEPNGQYRVIYEPIALWAMES